MTHTYTHTHTHAHTQIYTCDLHVYIIFYHFKWDIISYYFFLLLLNIFHNSLIIFLLTDLILLGPPYIPTERMKSNVFFL